MIHFSCKCGHGFNLLDAQAGEEIQCPACGLLNDVPLPADLAAIDEDGAFKLDDAPKPVTPDRLREQLRYFGGKEDVRHSMDEFLDIGVDEPSAIGEANGRGFAIDPFTGEEVRPLDLKADRDPLRVIPVAQVRADGATLEYARATPHGHHKAISPWRVPGELFTLGNLTVLFFLFIAHGLLQFTGAIVFNAGFIFLIFAPIFLLFALLGHLANVADETGPSGRDQLPTLLRNVSVSEDVWHPFCAVVIAGFICFAPAAWWASRGPAGVPFHLDAVLLLAVGAVFFPAIFLTTATSGAYRNLLPHHVWRVMTVAPRGYLGLVALFFATLVTYGGAFYFVHVYGLFGGSIAPVNRAFLFVPAAPALLIGLFVLNWFGWCCGLFYRGHHAQFDWALQRHIRGLRADAVSQLEHRNRAGRRPPAPAPAGDAPTARLTPGV